MVALPQGPVRKVGMSMAQPGVVAPWRATYVPGDWFLIAGPTSLVVLEPGSGRADMIADLWADVVASSSMSDLIDRLAGYGITELPDLAVVFWSQAGMRTLVRGGVELIDAGSGQPVATGEGIVTWNEVALDDLTKVRVKLRGQTPDGELLPLAVGVVRVGAISISADDEAVVRSPQPLLRSAGRVAGPAEGSAAAVSAAVQPGGPEPDAVETDPVGPTGAESPAEDLAAEAPAAVVAEAPETADEQSEHASAAADDDTGPDFPPIDSDLDDQSPTDESAAVGLDSPWGPQSGSAAVPGAVGLGAVGLGAVGPGTVGAGSAAGVGSPFEPDRPAATSPSPPEFSIEQFEMENDDTQLIANPVIVGGQPAGPGSSAPTGPLVEASRCPNGHANAPGSPICRICRSPIPPGPPVSIPAPLLARLRAADGTVVDLDRAVLLGRAPSEQRSTVPLPRLVTLASPAQDISRTHLQIVPENWQVVVTDLNSTNGTFVTDPGPNGNRGLLPPGHPTPVPIGATLELGEGVTVTIEAAD